MIGYLSELPHIKFQIMPGYADYYPDKPGGTEGGRGINAALFAGSKLGPLLNQMRRGTMKGPFGWVFTGTEGRKLGLLKTNRLHWLIAFKAVFRNLFATLARRKHLAVGEALIGQLRLTLHEQNVPVWLNSSVESLIIEDDAILGVEVITSEGKKRIRASKGVVLASGGFPHNKTLREKYQKAPVSTEWTVAAPGNTGEIIEMAMEAGAAVDLMEEAWWGPTTIPPGEPVHFMVAERSYPGGIIVNAAGHRFTNESASFTDVVQEMYRQDTREIPHIPAYFITDSLYLSRYYIGPLMPGNIPEKLLKSGYVVKADNINELAEKCDISPEGLAETVTRFNGYAQSGKDLDFNRGESAYDRFYSDPSAKPNCCLGAIVKPPYYAIRIYPGDLGTKGGLVTNEYAQVLKENGDRISGLYAVGNTAASVMGATYPGPGCTISPAMTFGYIAAKDAAGTLKGK